MEYLEIERDEKETGIATIRAGESVDLQTGLLMERDAFELCLASPDAREGTSAFLEKRKARFTGRIDD